jgi:para-aminobenzoate synthetase component II
MILVIDNYDSFTFNLVQHLGELGAELEVRRNDQITLDEIEAMDPEEIVVSPGPCTPKEAGVSVDLIKRFAGVKPILGVCLGHQAIAEVFGGSIRNLEKVYHGVSSAMQKTVGDEYLFKGVPQVFDAGRYHSWIVEEETLPDCLEVTVRNVGGAIMALRHKKYDVRGVQFHPESVLTEYGGMMIKNWIEGEQTI